SPSATSPESSGSKQSAPSSSCPSSPSPRSSGEREPVGSTDPTTAHFSPPPLSSWSFSTSASRPSGGLEKTRVLRLCSLFNAQGAYGIEVGRAPRWNNSSNRRRQ